MIFVAAQESSEAENKFVIPKLKRSDSESSRTSESRNNSVEREESESDKKSDKNREKTSSREREGRDRQRRDRRSRSPVRRDQSKNNKYSPRKESPKKEPVEERLIRMVEEKIREMQSKKDRMENMPFLILERNLFLETPSTVYCTYTIQSAYIV